MESQDSPVHSFDAFIQRWFRAIDRVGGSTTSSVKAHNRRLGDRLAIRFFLPLPALYPHRATL